MSIDKLIQDTLAELGLLRVSDVAAAVIKSPLATVLQKSNVRFEDAKKPAPGEKWQNVTTDYVVLDTELLRPITVKQLVHLVQTRRTAALLVLLEKLGAAFVAKAGAEREGWKIHLLRGQWLRETATRLVGQLGTRVVLDTTYAFVREKPGPDPGERTAGPSAGRTAIPGT